MRLGLVLFTLGSLLAYCSGTRRGHPFWRIAGYRKTRARVYAHTILFLPPASSHILLSFLILLLPHLHAIAGIFRMRGAGLVLDHGAAASSGTTRVGLRDGGRPRLSRAPARTPPISEDPLRGAGRWENSLLAVTDVDGDSSDEAGSCPFF